MDYLEVVGIAVIAVSVALCVYLLLL